MPLPFGKSFHFAQRPGIKATITTANLTAVLSSTQLWYDLSSVGPTYSPQPSGSIVSGSSITSVRDISGANHNTNAASNLKYNTFRAGSLSAGDLTAGGYFNTNSTTSWLGNIAGMTVVVACKPTVTGSLIYLANTDQGDLQIFYSASVWNVKCAGGTGVSGATFSNNTWQIHSFVYDGTGATNAQKLRYRYNKADQGLNITGTITAKSNGSNDNYVWGAQDTSALNPFKGYIGEVLLFNKALTVTEVEALETYLGSKWGI